jgi:hypothetical protein
MGFPYRREIRREFLRSATRSGDSDTILCNCRKDFGQIPYEG